MRTLVDTRDAFYLAVLIVVRTLRAIGSVSLDAAVVDALAQRAYAASRGKDALARDNLARAFGDRLPDSAASRILKDSYRAFWDDTLHLLPRRGGSRSNVQGRIQGQEGLVAALGLGRGVILWESRVFGRRNAAKQILRRHGYSVVQVYGDDHLAGFADTAGPDTRVRRAIVRPAFERIESVTLGEIIRISGKSLAAERTLLERLNQNAILSVAADGQFGQRHVTASFLGRELRLPTGMISLARLTGAPLVPIFCVRPLSGEPLLIVEEPAVVQSGDDRDGTFAKIAGWYATLLESYVRAYPAEYRNWHALA